MDSRGLSISAERHAMEGMAGWRAKEGLLAMSELSRLRWQCRRGLKELDLLLEKYLNDDFVKAPPAEKEAFAALLDLPDPVLLAYIMGRDQPDAPEQLHVVESLRRTPRS